MSRVTCHIIVFIFFIHTFWSEGLLKIFSQRITDLMSQLMNHEGVCRTAPTTPGLLITTLHTVYIFTCNVLAV